MMKYPKAYKKPVLGVLADQVSVAWGTTCDTSGGSATSTCIATGGVASSGSCITTGPTAIATCIASGGSA